MKNFSRIYLCIALAPFLAAQTTSTTLLGTVADASSAGVPGVEVSATHVATNQSRTAATNDLGYYPTFPF